MDFLFQRHQKEKHSSIIHCHGDNLTSPSLLVIPYLNLQRHSNALRALHRTGGPFIHAQRNDLRKCLRKSKIVLDSHWPSCFYTNCHSKYVTREMSLSQTVCFFWKDTFAVRSHILVCDSLVDVQSIYICVWARKHWQEAYTHTLSTGRHPGNSVPVTCCYPAVNFQATRPDSNTLRICSALWIWL